MQAIKSIIECPERHIEIAEYVKEKYNSKRFIAMDCSFIH